jgi:protein-histidine pros-kinase
MVRPADLGGLLEAAPDAMVVIDVRGLIVLVNAQTEKVFGFRRDELLGEPVDMLVPAALRAVHRQHRDDYVGEPHVRSMGSGLDLRACRKDGSEFPVEISLAPLETTDGLLVSAAIRDISERRQAQADAERVKDEFFATVSHELRTPLSSMLGYSELMADLEELSPQGRRFLQVITRSAERELRLVDDLLNRDPLLTGKGAVRGIFAAQEIKPQARVLATDRDISCAVVDYDALRGLDDPTERLF